jgi:hypothetical protein
MRTAFYIVGAIGLPAVAWLQMSDGQWLTAAVCWAACALMGVAWVRGAI